MRVQTLAALAFVIGLIWMLAGCTSYSEKEKQMPDTPLRGTINVSADESFRPVIDELVAVYESNNPATNIRVTYKPEADCLRDIFNDSVRVVIATRGYNKAEEKFIIDSLRLQPAQLVVARDAVAVIVNPASPDTLFSMPDVKEILTGGFKKNLIPVFDGVQATSTVRYIVDSILKGNSLTKSAVAATSSEGVIDYVSKTPNAVGFIGVSWIGNKEDSSQISFLQKVKIARLESIDTAGLYVHPVQTNIYLQTYPMVRDLVYIRKEKHLGLGKGFTDFLTEQIGQLIFKRAYLVPARNNFISRPVRLRD